MNFDTGQFLNAFSVGQQQGQQRQQRNLQKEIGGLAAQGDFSGAGNMAYGAGQLEVGNAFGGMASAQKAQASAEEKTQILALGDAIMQNPDIYPALIADLENPQLGTGAVKVPPALRNDPRAGAAYLYRMAGERMPEGPEYFAPMEVVGPDGKPTLVQGSKAGGVQPLQGYAPYEAPKAPGFERVTTNEGIFEYIPGQPDTMRKIGEAPVRTPQTVVNVNPDGQQPVDPLRIGGKGKEESVVRGLDGEPIVVPGEQAQIYNKTKNSIVSRERREGLVMQDIDRALELSEQAFTTGFVGGAVSNIPGTPAFNLNKVLDGIVANIGFDELTSMRENSPNGGALGSVTENELALLQSVMGSLQQAQTKEQFQFHLNRLKSVMTDAREARRNAFAQDFPSLRDYNEFRLDTATTSAQSRSRPAPTAGTVQDGYEFIGGDPANPESWRQVQ